MPKNPKVTLVGDVCIDHNIVNGRKYINWGSSLMYMGRYLRNHTALDVSIIATHGNDFKKYIDAVKIINKPAQVETLVYNNIVTGDSRTQFCYNVTSSMPVNIDEQLKKSLGSTNIFVFAPLTPNYQSEYISELLKLVPVKSLKVLSPQGYMRYIGDDGLVSKSEFINEANIIPFFDIVVASDEDCFDALNAAKRWASYKESLNVVITQNKNGATLVNREDTRHVETIPVPASKIVDPVGSGDVFTAELTANYYKTKDIIQAIQAGNAAARKKLLTDIPPAITEP